MNNTIENAKAWMSKQPHLKKIFDYEVIEEMANDFVNYASTISEVNDAEIEAEAFKQYPLPKSKDEIDLYMAMERKGWIEGAKHFRSRSQQSWVEIKQGDDATLPEIFHEMLALQDCGVIDIQYRDKDSVWYLSSSHIHIMNDVTHWMPLPAKPKTSTT
jgi:hypothetical protein